MNFDATFTPMHIGGMQVKNRLVVPAMLTCTCTADGTSTNATADYYRSRALVGRLQYMPCGADIVKSSWQTANAKRSQGGGLLPPCRSLSVAWRTVRLQRKLTFSLRMGSSLTCRPPTTLPVHSWGELRLTAPVKLPI